MKKLSILTYIAFALSVAILLVGVANTNAEETNERLKGTYALNLVGTCTLASGYTQTIHLQGQLVFNGDGTGESSLIALITNHNPAITGEVYPVVRDLTGNFTYSVWSDDYFTTDSNLTVVGTPVTISGIMQEGRIGHGAQTLLISDTDTNIETLWVGGSVLTTRTCGRNSTAVKFRSN